MRSGLVALTVLAVLGSGAPALAEPTPTATPSPIEVSPSPSSTETPTALPTPARARAKSTPTSDPSTDAPTPSASATTTIGPYGITLGQPVPSESWCQTLRPPQKGDAAKAASIMDDNVVDLEQYGYYTLQNDPLWNRQKTADSSGNDHINGLNWALPLLYTGIQRDDPEMVNRFFDLIGDWLSKHKKKSTRTWAVTQPIIAGERLSTLTCAVDISAGARFVSATRKEATRQVDTFRLGGGTNNTGIHSQGAALAAFCYLQDDTGRNRATDNLNRLASYLVLPDGSDREGSPWYAYYTLRLMHKLEPTYSRCGQPYDAIQDAILRSEKFLAAAVDPNFQLVMNGDTMRAKLDKKWFAPDSVTRWAATGGQDGKAPSKLYNVFSGGYVFGRNSWTDVDGHRPTFYTVRASRPYVTAHVHSDLGSVTFHSYGTEWLGDPGPYRYDTSAIRNYMVSRSGHSVIRVTAKPKAKKASITSLGIGVRLAVANEPSAVISAKAGPYNQTCLKDGTYSTARIKRCVYYDSTIDGLVVVDSIKATARIRADQRWQIPNGVSVTAGTDGATMTSSGAAARVLFSGGGDVRTYRPTAKRPDGWFTDGYGKLVKGTVLQRGSMMPKGSTLTWVTVIAAGESAPDVALKDNLVTVTRKHSKEFQIP